MGDNSSNGGNLSSLSTMLRSPHLCMGDNSSNGGNLSSLSTMLRPGAVAHVIDLPHGKISCANATLVSVLAAPLFLGNGPPLDPICESRIAVVGRGRMGIPSLAISWAASAMDVATPLLLVDG